MLGGLASVASFSKIPNLALLTAPITPVAASSLLYWYLGGSLNEIRGSNAYNFANNTYDGVIVNDLTLDTNNLSPTATALSLEASFHFDNGNQALSAPTPLSFTSIQIANGFTYCCWVKTKIPRAQNTSALGFFNSVNYNNTSPGISFMFNNNDRWTFEQWAGGNNPTIVTNVTIDDSYFQTWVHLCITTTKTNVIFYKNGTAVLTQSTNVNYPANTPTAFPLTFGNIPFFTASNNFNFSSQSYMSDMRVYNTVLSAGQVSQIYNGTG